jgi:hypothetical protein
MTILGDMQQHDSAVEDLKCDLVTQRLIGRDERGTPAGISPWPEGDRLCRGRHTIRDIIDSLSKDSSFASRGWGRSNARRK